MISVLILTRNEQKTSPAASPASPGPTTSTSSTPKAPTPPSRSPKPPAHTVHTRAFDDYATHRNAALTTVPFKHSWVFLLDADERPTPELSREMQQLALAAPPETAAFRVRRRDYLFGTWLKHAQLSPFYIRLVRPERAHYTRAINEVLEVDGSVAELSYPLDHYPFSKGIAKWVEKHNLYSTMEAELIARNQGLQNPSMMTRPPRPRLPHPPPPPEGDLLPPPRPPPPQVALHGLPPRSHPRRRRRPHLRHPASLLRIPHRRSRPKNSAAAEPELHPVTPQIEVVVHHHSLRFRRYSTQFTASATGIPAFGSSAFQSNRRYFASVAAT